MSTPSAEMQVLLDFLLQMGTPEKWLAELLEHHPSLFQQALLLQWQARHNARTNVYNNLRIASPWAPVSDTSDRIWWRHDIVRGGIVGQVLGGSADAPGAARNWWGTLGCSSGGARSAEIGYTEIPGKGTFEEVKENVDSLLRSNYHLWVLL